MKRERDLSLSPPPARVFWLGDGPEDALPIPPGALAAAPAPPLSEQELAALCQALCPPSL